jgi:hypothetical protein
LTNINKIRSIKLFVFFSYLIIENISFAVASGKFKARSSFRFGLPGGLYICRQISRLSSSSLEDVRAEDDSTTYGGEIYIYLKLMYLFDFRFGLPGARPICRRTSRLSSSTLEDVQAEDNSTTDGRQNLILF